MCLYVFVRVCVRPGISPRVGNSPPGHWDSPGSPFFRVLPGAPWLTPPAPRGSQEVPHKAGKSRPSGVGSSRWIGSPPVTHEISSGVGHPNGLPVHWSPHHRRAPAESRRTATGACPGLVPKDSLWGQTNACGCECGVCACGVCVCVCVCARVRVKVMV